MAKNGDSAQQEQDNVIVVENLTKSFSGRVVVDNVSMQIRKGEVFGFLGANGSGKTTTMRMLCGLLTPDSGKGYCLGHDVTKEAEWIKKKIGYMPQHFSYYRDLTVQENLWFIANLRGKQAQDNVIPMMEKFHLLDRQHHLAGKLSGGWKQRLSLAACLLHEPELIFLDEPTAGVDPESRRYFWDVIHDLADSGVTVLVTTHYMDEAERCNRLGFISYGVLQAVGTRQEILHDAGLYAFSVCVKNHYRLAKMVEEAFPDEMVVVFGDDFHIVTANKKLDQAVVAMVRAFSEQASITLISTTVEHIFIQLIKQRRAYESG